MTVKITYHFMPWEIDYAFAKICKLKKINFFCFKYISDIVGGNKQESDWIENYHKGRFTLKESVIKLL